MTILDTGIYW